MGIGVVLLLIGTPMVLWLMTYHSDAAVTMFIITWLSMTVFVLMMAKKSVSDPAYFVDKKVLAQTRQEIEVQRQLVRRELLKNEIEALLRGEKTPILDVWRLDESLAKRHPYFTSAQFLLIDPEHRELQVRLQIGEIGSSDAERKIFPAKLFNELIAYLRIISQDAYLVVLKEFFDVVILQIDSLREDDRRIDTPYPVLSLLAAASGFWSIRTIQGFDKRRLLEVAEVLFDDGNEIQPHRVIDLHSARGLK